MTDDLVTQALADLQDLVRCRCHPAYTGRGLRDPDCECDSTEAVKAVADHIEAQAAEIERLRGALAKLTKASDRVHDSYWNSTDGIIVGMYNLGEALREARTTLAELTGGKDE